MSKGNLTLRPLKIRIGSDVLETKSAGKDTDMLLEIDIRKHAIWTKSNIGDQQASDRAKEYNNKFLKKFKQS